MPRGSGRSLGAALTDLWRHGGRPGGTRSSYTATGWKGQFTELTATKAGYAAMEAAGISATIETQRNWLAGRTEPRRATQDLIHQAYQSMRGGFDRSTFADTDYEITGRVTLGRDSRERGMHGTSPLRIDGRVGDWTPIEQAWNDGAGQDTLEALFIQHVLIPDLGEGSHPWVFNGDFYLVVSR